MTIIAETERLILRHFVPDDLEALAGIVGDARVMEFSVRGPKSRDEARAMLDRITTDYQRLGHSYWAVEHRADARLIGLCGLLVQEIDGQREIEIGYRFHPDYWGRGFATEAARATRDDAVHNRGLRRLISIIEAANTRSIRVAEKNGMTLEKTATFHDLPVRIYAWEADASTARDA